MNNNQSIKVIMLEKDKIKQTKGSIIIDILWEYNY